MLDRTARKRIMERKLEEDVRQDSKKENNGMKTGRGC